MSLPLGIVKTDHLRFPRVSGDEPSPTNAKSPHPQFSPRERG